MPGKYEERSLLSFQKTFATDEDCAQHLAEQRWAVGFTCPRCG
ncbi:MAG: transposase, partial [Armatimonadetes bacterium]|nr:transposase [Armatimonadota bacterium]